MEDTATAPENPPPASASGAPQSQQQASSQQEPVNFNPGYGRRVTLGGMHGNNAMDRRGSLASIGVDDLFGRRPSMGSVGFDVSIDNLVGRRDSMDSTTAALDAAIVDLARRRSSMWGSGGSDMGAPLPPGIHDSNSLSSFGGVPPGGMGYSRNPSLGAFNVPPMPPSLPSYQQNAVSTIASRQAQLQQQQRELEQYQKVLEMQRQQLLVNMQDRNYPADAPMSPTMQTPRFSQTGDMGYGHQGMDTSMRSTMSSRGGGGLGGSMHSSYSHSTQGTGMVSQYSQQNRPSNTDQNWWICQICNSKAFASQEEAMVHERHCQDGSRRGSNDLIHPMPMNDMSQRSSYSLGMDSSHRSNYSDLPMPDTTRMANGPFATLDEPMCLAMESDKDWLTPLHCFVRRHCVEIFTASEQDVATPSKGKRKPIQVGQIGIRCPHCCTLDTSANKARERGSVYYPTSISSIYNATMNLLQRHLHHCPAIPEDIMRRYESLKADDARSGTSKRYWVESALSLGLVDTPNGIRYSALRPPLLPGISPQQAATTEEAQRRTSESCFSTNSNAVTDSKKHSKKPPQSDAAAAKSATEPVMTEIEQDLSDSAPLVTEDDKPYSTTFSYHLMSQMQPCVFTEADRLGKRKGLPPGFPGLACRHCFGGYGSGRFFPSSIKTLSDTSKTLNVLHNHMQRCRKCPAEVRESLESLRSSHDEERAKMKFGSQKAFFARVWERLHGKGQPAAFKRKLKPKEAPRPPQQMMPSPQGYHPTVDRASFQGMPQMPPPNTQGPESMGPPPPSPRAKRRKVGKS